MASTQNSQQLAISKRLANGSGIFLSGAQPIDLPGADGIIGTRDDDAAGPQALERPDSSGIYVGTRPPDNCISPTNYTRTITITPYTVVGAPLDNLNSATITVSYINPQLHVPQSYILQSLISEYR